VGSRNAERGTGVAETLRRALESLFRAPVLLRTVITASDSRIAKGDFFIPRSDFLEPLRVPVWLRDAAFAFVFEKFVHRREDDSGAAGFETDVEIEFVFEKINVAVADHAEKFAGDFEIVGVNDAVLDRERGVPHNYFDLERMLLTINAKIVEDKIYIISPKKPPV